MNNQFQKPANFVINRKTLSIDYEDINGFLEKSYIFKSIEDLEKYIINSTKDLIFDI